MTHVHLIGIGGTGLSAIARVLLESGYTVSGSDRALSPLAENLRADGIHVDIGHRSENIQGADLVVRSSAVRDENPEVQAAIAAGIPVLKRAEFLGQLMSGKTGIAVAGTHGKTTTTAMIAWMLSTLGQDPSFIVGGVLKNLATNAHAGKGSTFVIEADEYDHMFLGLQPVIEVITFLEHDHPDCYPTWESYQQAFVEFVQRMPTGGVLVTNADQPAARSLLSEASRRGLQALSYAIHQPADYQAEQLVVNTWGSFSFEACRTRSDGSQTRLAQVALRVPGEHNVRNALAALAVADQLGLSSTQAAEALGAFEGTGRRFDVLGEAAGVTVIDDYAHHPTEIRATLAAARTRFPGRRLWAVWQPHTYSRTRALFAEFAAAFQDADQVIVTDIYAAREPAEAFSSAQVVAAMHNTAARYIATLPEVVATLNRQLLPGDVLLVLSAGDADQVSSQVLAGLQERTGQDA